MCISGSPQEKIAAHDIRHTDKFLFAFRINESGSGRISATTATNSIYFLFDSRVAELDPEPMFHVIAQEFVHLWGRHSLAIGQGDTPSQELTYQGGWLLAAWLDAAIRKKALLGDNKHEFIPSAGDVAKPGTLDVLMRDFNNDPRWNKHVRPTPALFLERPARYLPAEQVTKFEKFTTEPWQFNSVPRCNDGACTDAKSSSVTFSMFHATADIQGRFKTSRKRRVWKLSSEDCYFGMGLMVSSSADRSERVNASGSSIQMQWPAFWIVSRRAFGRALTSLGQNVGPRST